MREHETCEVCGSPIYYEDDFYEQDEAYYIDEQYLCEDCIWDYMKNNYKVRLRKADNYREYEKERSRNLYGVI